MEFISVGCWIHISITKVYESDSKKGERNTTVLWYVT